jgi:hypothetical protein
MQSTGISFKAIECRMTLLDFSPADFKQFLTVLADRRLFGNHCLFRTGLVANGIRLTKQCSAQLSSRCDARTWRRIHWSDKSRFLLHATDGRMRVWRQKDMVYSPRNIQPTVPYRGGSVMIMPNVFVDVNLIIWDV